MTRSIFDPSNGGVERDGSSFTLPDAEQASHLPEIFKNPPSAEVTGDIDFTPPPPEPAVAVSSENDGKLLLIRLTGKLHKGDYQQFVPIVEKAVETHGKIRMLVQMHMFHGWDAGALWEDVKFDVKHFNDLERLAIVGESTWEKWMVTFCKPFTTATIRFFPSGQEAEARAWITAA